LGHRYLFRVIEKTTNYVLHERVLNTVNMSRSDARIAMMSCMKDSKEVLHQMWDSALAANADYYFFIGDNVYGDSLLSHGPNKLWSRYIETRATLNFYHWKHLKPVIAIWDDHDYGRNNEDGKYKH